MPTQQDKAWEYAEKLLARPQRRIEVTLRHGKSGASLLHEKRAMVICPDTRVGRLQAELVARALGVELPGYRRRCGRRRQQRRAPPRHVTLNNGPD